MTFADFLGALRARWWVVVAGVLVGIAASMGAFVLMPSQYVSTTQLFVSASSVVTSSVQENNTFAQARVLSYAQIIQGDLIARRVAMAINQPGQAQEIQQDITAAAVPNTVLIEVTVQSDSAATSRAIAAAVGQVFTSYVNELEASVADTSAPIKVTVTQTPQMPTHPSSPDLARLLLIGTLGGLVLGVVIAVGRELLDRGVRSAKDLESVPGASVLGEIPYSADLSSAHLVTASNVPGAVSEAYRAVRASLTYTSVDTDPRILMVTSAVPSEGKTTLTINLASVLALSGASVCVLECDLRRPKVASYLGLIDAVGLTDVVAQGIEIGTAVQRQGNLFDVMSAGTAVPNPTELLASIKTRNVIDQLKQTYDYVVLDAPPTLVVSDALTIASFSEGVILAIKYASTSIDAVAKATESISRTGTPLLGVVLSQVRGRRRRDAYYSYSYDSQYT